MGEEVARISGKFIEIHHWFTFKSLFIFQYFFNSVKIETFKLVSDVAFSRRMIHAYATICHMYPYAVLLNSFLDLFDRRNFLAASSGWTGVEHGRHVLAPDPSWHGVNSKSHKNSVKNPATACNNYCSISILYWIIHNILKGYALCRRPLDTGGSCLPLCRKHEMNPKETRNRPKQTMCMKLKTICMKV